MQTKTYRDLVARVFPRFPNLSFHFECSLVVDDVNLCYDWPLWLLWFSFFYSQLKTALLQRKATRARSLARSPSVATNFGNSYIMRQTLILCSMVVICMLSYLTYRYFISLKTAKISAGRDGPSGFELRYL